MIRSAYISRMPHAAELLADNSPLQPDGYERLIAEWDGVICGFIDFGLQNGYVRYLFVHPEFQGRGSGSALLLAAERLMGRPVTVSTPAVNDGGLRWYMRRRYEIVGGQLDEDWHGGPVVWVRLRKQQGEEGGPSP